MINLMEFGLQKLTLMSALLVSTLLLQGCGGAREFNDSGSSSSSNSSFVSINVDAIESGNAFDALSLGDEAKVFVISSQDEFEKELPKYRLASSYDKNKYNFKEGQIVIYYGGRETDCPSFQYSNYSVKTYENDNGLRFVSFIVNRTINGMKVSSSTSDASGSSVSFLSSSVSSSSSSVSCQESDVKHPYKFFYVYTRALILPGVNP